jgi:hypothetical protein
LFRDAHLHEFFASAHQGRQLPQARLGRGGGLGLQPPAKLGQQPRVDAVGLG